MSSVEMTDEQEAMAVRLWHLRRQRFEDETEAEIRSALAGPDPLAALTAAVEEAAR